MAHFHRCWVCEKEEAIYCEEQAPAEYCLVHDHSMIPPPVCPDCASRAKAPTYATKTQQDIGGDMTNEQIAQVIFFNVTRELDQKRAMEWIEFFVPMHLDLAYQRGVEDGKKSAEVSRQREEK